MTQDLTPENSQLGRATQYRSDYAPELLFPIPRIGKREELGLVAGSLPFVGCDLWNAYELSWLNPRGKPVVAIGQISFDATTPRLIESKSLKLYLNSLNQTRFADIETVRQTIERDLATAAQGEVRVALQDLAEQPVRHFAYPDGVCLDSLDIDIDTYQPSPGLLGADAGREVINELLYSHLLKSNCLVTGQPDWGSVMVRYSGPAIAREGLLRYLVSFRQHNEFHEQCVERIYCDIMRHCAPRELMVWARYTRRGGLDINPLRASCKADWPGNLFELRQ